MDLGNPGYHRAALRAAEEHGHRILVFDGQNRLHIPLTVFAKEAHARVADGTARTYLSAVLPFFTFLEADRWQVQAKKRWDSEPHLVREAVEDYLVQQVRCKVREHRLGFQVVAITAGTRSTIRVFLSGLKMFYRVARERGYYRYENPLIDATATRTIEVLEQLEEAEMAPRMPEKSGVAEPHRKRRLSDSYFKLQGEVWVPQVVDDPSLPARILGGGQRVGWSLREEVITRLLFETGGRISEVTRLTLGDWSSRGLLQEANAFSKGSHGVRVKFLRFSGDTAKLLRRYFDEERCKRDPQSLTVDEYLRLGKIGRVDLQQVSLFLTTRGTQLGPEAFRVHWNQACMAAGIEVDCHQCRHWYTTMAVRQIYEQSQAEAEVKRRLRELIEYMKWRSGEVVLEAYQHYFDAARHAEIQDLLYARMDQALKQRTAQSGREESLPRRVALQQAAAELPDDPEFVFLRSLGGDNSGR